MQAAKVGMAVSNKKQCVDSTLSLMLAKLETSCLSAADAKLLKMHPTSAGELKSLNLPDFQAFEIPYFLVNGKTTDFKRYRYLEDTRTGIAKSTDKKAMRYVQAKGTMSEVYLPPFTDWQAVFDNVTQPIIITEGELKAACATKYGHPCIGLGGVYSFKSNKKQAPLLPIFYSIKWSGRSVYVVFDSDASTNPMVVTARSQLCRALLHLGAVPHIIELDPAPDGKKQGLDDVVQREGPDCIATFIAEAVAYSAAAALFDLNSEVAYITDPGMIVVLETGKVMRPYDFTSHAYANWHYTEFVATSTGSKPVIKDAAVEWLKWENRLFLNRLTYAPGADRVTESREYNTWSGWGTVPKKGDIKPWLWLLDRVFGKDKAARDWQEKWLAYPIQHPGTKMFTSCALWGGRQGTGKSSIGYSVARIYGSNFIEVGNEALADGRNEWVIGKQFVMGDDITGNDQRGYADKLKKMITQLSVRVDPKYVPSYSIPDCINYLFTSQHPDAFFLEDDDRRMFIHEVRTEPMTEQESVAYYHWLNNGGAEALHYHFLHLGLTGISPVARAPLSTAKLSMIDDGLSEMGRWVRRILDDPDQILRMHNIVMPGDLWSAPDLLALYDPEGKGKVTSGGMGKEMKRAGFSQIQNGEQVRTNKGQLRLFIVRNKARWEKGTLSEASKHYNKSHKVSNRKS